MKNELEDLLHQRYPGMFAKRELAPGQYSMQWGFECGDGWFDLIDTLCANIQYGIDHADTPAVHVLQVKSKLGTLRFHFRGGDERVRGMADMAMAFSALVCQECGAIRCQTCHEQGVSDPEDRAQR
jgi:hypothetical protein